MGTLINEVGNVYGKLEVLLHSGPSKNGGAMWKCKCECGGIVVVFGTSLRKGFAVSCGCMGRLFPGRRILLREMNRKDKDVYTKYLSRKWREYRLREDDIRELMDSQRGMCAICKSTLVLGERGGAHIDHNHETGEVRGFLCSNCNRGNRAYARLSRCMYKSRNIFDDS